MSNPIQVIKLTGISGSIEGKADVDHDHTLADITDAGSAAAASTSDFATAAQGVAADNSIQKGTLASVNADITDATLIDTTDPRLSDARTPTTHDHTLSDITNAGTSASLDVATTGDANASEVVKGDDSRLSDTRDPNAHSHVESDISNLGTNVVLKSQVDISAASWVVDEDNLGSNSDTVVPTQASVKAYVDSAVGSPLTGAEIKTAYEAELDTNAFTDAEKTKLAGIDTGATDDQTGAEIKLAYEGEADTNAFTDAEQTKLAGIEDAATADQTGAEIKLAYEGELDTNAFTDAEKAKLAGIVSGATGDLTGAEIKIAYEGEADTNAFTDSEKSKLTGIETGATADMTGAEIKALYEAEPNAFTDSLKSKLDSIEFNATSDQTGAEIKLAYEAEPNTNAFTDEEKNKLADIPTDAAPDQTGQEIKALYESQDNTNAYTDADAEVVESISRGDYTLNTQSTVAGNSWVIDDDTMATASPNTVASSISIKNYIEAQGFVSDIGVMTFRGEYNASTNIPDLDGSAPREPVSAGDVYVVSAAGTFWSQAVTEGALIIATADNPSSIAGWEVVLGGGSGITDITNESIGSLSDVTLGASVNTGEVLLWNGSAFTNQALSITGATVTVEGPTAPTNASAGDFWFNTETALLYIYYVDDNSSQWVVVSQQGPKGDQGIQGIQGPSGGEPGADGADGRTILSGAVVPTGVDGQDGDFFLRTDTSQLYGPKTSGVWGSPVSLVGPQGTQGFSITFLGELASAANLPSSGNTQGDAYILSDDKTLRVYDGSTFVSGGSLEGPQGDQGIEGPTGPQGPQGIQGPTGQAMYDLVGTVLTITNDTSADYSVSGNTLTITT